MKNGGFHWKHGKEEVKYHEERIHAIHNEYCEFSLYLLLVLSEVLSASAQEI